MGFIRKELNPICAPVKKKHVNGLNGGEGNPKLPIYDIEDGAMATVLNSTWQGLTLPQKFRALAFVIKGNEAQ